MQRGDVAVRTTAVTRYLLILAAFSVVATVACRPSERRVVESPLRDRSPDARFVPPPAQRVASANQVSNENAPGSLLARVDSESTVVPAADDESAGYLNYVAAHCLVDRFKVDVHSVESLQARGLVPLDQARPFLPRTKMPPKPGHRDYPVYMAQLRADWLSNPRSHVLDCTVTVEPRTCETCKTKSSAPRTFRYGIYIPRQYVENPGQVKTVLLLAPGGRGGRVRWFQNPIAYKMNKSRMSQGLSIQSKLDAHLEMYPELSPPLVITMDDPGLGYTNGTQEYMTDDLVGHVLATYLPGKTRENIAFGIDAISSAAKNAAIAFVSKPEAFDTFGWMCNFCDSEGGFDPDRYFRRAKGQRALDVWFDRAQAGELHMKFSIGKQDKFLACNRRMHSLLVERNIIPDAHEPFEENCKEVEGSTASACTTIKPGMTEYPGIGHNYSLMPLAFDEHLYWHVEKLSEVARVKANQPSSALQVAQNTP